MRRLVVMAVLCVAWGMAAAEPPARSNPPFLGIGLDDSAAAQGGPMGVTVNQVTDGTGAKAAGIKSGDLIQAIDNTQLLDHQQFGEWIRSRTSRVAGPVVKGPVDVLMDRITAHEIGDSIHLGILRNGQHLEIDAVLSSRADILQQQLVGKPLDMPVEDVDSARAFNLGELGGKTTVVGWVFHDHRGNGACVGCERVLAELSDRLHKRRASDDTRILEVTNEEPTTIKQQRQRESSTIETAVVNTELLQEQLVVADNKRVHLAVVDCQGVVRFVAPLYPGADDEDAVYDEVIAAVAQADHRAHR